MAEVAKKIHQKLRGEREIIVGRGGRSYCGNCGHTIEDEAGAPDVINIVTNDGVARMLCPGCRYDLLLGRDCSELEQGEDYVVGW